MNISEKTPLHSSNGQAEKQNQNSTGLVSDLDYLAETINELKAVGIEAFNPPELSGYGEYEKFVHQHTIDNTGRLLLCLALAQYSHPRLFQSLVVSDNAYALIISTKDLFILPTAETFIGLYSAGSPEMRIKAHQYFDSHHLFYSKGIISLGETEEGASPYFGVLKINPGYRDLFLYNKYQSPRFSPEFPAHRIETPLEWEDLILGKFAESRIKEVLLVTQHQVKLNANLARHQRRGYRLLLNGPSGTGKTLTAKLLGKSLNREVYRVDLSAVISKYIGETSKNMNSLFNMAEDKNWILFFDEGDALFGKRVDTSQTDDKNSHYSNQDVAFLLQRIEEYSGLVIISTNLRRNMDPAFSRRFEMMVNYDELNKEQRINFWKNNLPPELEPGPGFNLSALADNFSRNTPGQIMNAIIRITNLCLARGDKELNYQELDRIMRDEDIK